MKSNPSPDEINARDPKRPVYRCFGCDKTTGLSWYRGTSCPVCTNPACIEKCDAEWDRAYYKDEEDT